MKTYLVKYQGMIIDLDPSRIKHMWYNENDEYTYITYHKNESYTNLKGDVVDDLWELLKQLKEPTEIQLALEKKVRDLEAKLAVPSDTNTHAPPDEKEGPFPEVVMGIFEDGTMVHSNDYVGAYVGLGGDEKIYSRPTVETGSFQVKLLKN